MSETKQKQKGTKVTEQIIGAAMAKVPAAIKNLLDASQGFVKLTETLEDNALKIADQEEKLANLTQEYKNRMTQNKIDLEMAYKADQGGFVNQYLTANHLTPVKDEELNELKERLRDLESEFDNKVHAEVSKAKAILESGAQRDAKLMESEYKAKEATNLAKIGAMEIQITQLKEWNTTLTGQLNAEREASVKRSQAQSATVNVAAPGK